MYAAGYLGLHQIVYDPPGKKRERQTDRQTDRAK